MKSMNRSIVLSFPEARHQPSADDDSHHNELLDHYLSLSPKRREKLYVDTGRAAELCGRARRTVRYWVECGWVRAVRLGMRNYAVEVASLKTFMHTQDGSESGKNFDAKNDENESFGQAS
jgi:hypothetical protein